MTFKALLMQKLKDEDISLFDLAEKLKFNFDTLYAYYSVEFLTIPDELIFLLDEYFECKDFCIFYSKEG